MAGVLDKLEQRILKRMDERMGPLTAEMQNVRVEIERKMQAMNKTLTESLKVQKEILREL
ncbi:unnamed protein product, partial [marine sediment metagenome]